MAKSPSNSELLTQWEEVYKKGLLSFWILLLLSQREVYAYEMRSAIESLSQGTMSADENSLYRALRRFADTGLVQSKTQPSGIGPPRRYFSLTSQGRELLAAFINRNICLFQSSEVEDAIQSVLAETHPTNR